MYNTEIKNAANILEVEEVSKSYRGRELYSNVTFEVPQGSRMAVTGPNGSGKSVLFRILCGFISPEQGTIRICPEFLSRRQDFPEKFGVLIDRPGYLPHRTGIQNLQELAAIRKQITSVHVREVMELVGLDPDLRQKVRHYSLGMKQKLGLAQALMEQPRVLILDEPFNALDSDTVIWLRRHLKELTEAGTTLIFTSHNQADVDDLATAELRIENAKVTRVA